MPTDVDDQLTTYFEWIERECGFGLHRPTRSAPQPAPTSPAGGPEIAVRVTREQPPRSSGLRIAAALAVAACVVGGLVFINANSGNAPATPAETAAVETAATAGLATTVPFAPDTASSPTSGLPLTPTTAPTTSVAPGRPLIENLALGESVMQAVQNVLPQYGVNVDAQESIQGKGIIENLRTTLATYDITGAVIIQAGTNGPVSQAQYDEMADLVAGLPHAYFLTIKAPLAWVPENNARIRALPATHPNVTVIDWEALAEQLGPDDLSKSDGGVHLNSGTAVRFYANMILGAIGKPLIPGDRNESATPSTR